MSWRIRCGNRQADMFMECGFELKWPTSFCDRYTLSMFNWRLTTDDHECSVWVVSVEMLYTKTYCDCSNFCGLVVWRRRYTSVIITAADTPVCSVSPRHASSSGEVKGSLHFVIFGFLCLLLSVNFCSENVRIKFFVFISIFTDQKLTTLTLLARELGSTPYSTPHIPDLVSLFSVLCPLYMGARGGPVGWSTALQAGRSRARFPMVSLEFFIDILPAALWPWDRPSL